MIIISSSIYHDLSLFKILESYIEGVRQASILISL